MQQGPPGGSPHPLAPAHVTGFSRGTGPAAGSASIPRSHRAAQFFLRPDVIILILKEDLAIHFRYAVNP